MGIEGTRARSHTHGKRHGRTTVHAVVVTLALLTVAFASYYPRSSSAVAPAELPGFVVSGIAATGGGQAHAFLQPPAHLQTQSTAALPMVATSTADTVRSLGAISQHSSFSNGVSAAVAASGEAGAGVKPLVDIVDPDEPFVLYVTREGDTVSTIATQYGITMETLLDNNKVISNEDMIAAGMQIVVPRRDGILHTVSLDETVGTIVNQYDNLTSEAVLTYRPNAITDPEHLEEGKKLLLIGATPKPPPPPPPSPVVVAAPPSSAAAGSPPPATGGMFGFPLTSWLSVTDPFGTYRGVGRIHEGIDLDVPNSYHTPVYSACDGTVIKTEYLTYSYGYHVVIDCGSGYTTLYAHFSEILVSPGQRVSQGTHIGMTGVTGFTTGEHLHFEIRLNGAPLNPALFLGF